MKNNFTKKNLLNLSSFIILIFFLTSYYLKVGYIINDRDEIAYLIDSLLLVEGIQPTMSQSPGGLSVWVGALYILFDFIVNNLNSLNIEELFLGFDLTLYENYKDLKNVKLSKFVFNTILLIYFFYLDKKKFLFLSFFTLYLIPPIYEITFASKPYFTATLLFFISFLHRDKNKILSLVFFGFAVAERLEFFLLIFLISNDYFKFNFRNILIVIITFLITSPWFWLSPLQNIKVLISVIYKFPNTIELDFMFSELISILVLVFFLFSTILYSFLIRNKFRFYDLIILFFCLLYLIFIQNLPIRWLLPSLILIICHLNLNFFEKSEVIKLISLIALCFIFLINFNLKKFISDKDIAYREVNSNYKNIISLPLLKEELNFIQYDKIYGTHINQFNIKNINFFKFQDAPLSFGENGNLEKRYHRRYQFLSKYDLSNNSNNKFVLGNSGLYFDAENWCKTLNLKPFENAIFVNNVFKKCN